MRARARGNTQGAIGDTAALPGTGLYAFRKAVGTSIPPSRSSDGNSEHHVRPAPSAQVTTLKHCRCVDCLFWRAAPVSECRHGTIRNGIGDPEYPPNAWHYCALYHGPQVSKDVWVWPRVAPRSHQVGAGSEIVEPSSKEPTPVITAATGRPTQMVPSPCKQRGYRGGNSRAPVFCLL